MSYLYFCNLNHDQDVACLRHAAFSVHAVRRTASLGSVGNAGRKNIARRRCAVKEEGALIGIPPFAIYPMCYVPFREPRWRFQLYRKRLPTSFPQPRRGCINCSMWCGYSGSVDNCCSHRNTHIAHSVTQVFRRNGDSNHC